MHRVGEAPKATALDTLEQVLCWQPGALGPHDDLHRCRVPLPQEHRCSGAPRPRLLACHDLAGGYGPDALLQGSVGVSSSISAGGSLGRKHPTSDGSSAADDGAAGFYCHAEWRAVDVLVYFSHRLATIPPPGWVAAAHRHGVTVLGTFITEWGAGAAVCQRAFATPLAAEALAAKLAAVAAHYGFEGWLINIENPVPPPLMPNLLRFVSVLTTLVHQQCGAAGGAAAAAAAAAPPPAAAAAAAAAASGPPKRSGGMVLWYDAVTIRGDLAWQDTLNALNKPFFDACDGIFTNYTWKAGAPMEAARNAGPRRACDVYMGVDVFGRNTYGGGGFSCNVAIAAARPAGIGIALFAPGWVWENAPNRAADYHPRQQRFWRHILDAWAGPGSSIGSSSSSSNKDNSNNGNSGAFGSDPNGAGAAAAGVCRSWRPSTWPLYSCFDEGCGRSGLHHAGDRVSSAPWYDLSLQSLQPLLDPLPSPHAAAGARAAAAVAAAAAMGAPEVGGDNSSGGMDLRAARDRGRAFSGGSCVEFSGGLAPKGHKSFLLFATRLPFSGESGLVVRYALLALAPGAQLEIGLCYDVGSGSGSDGGGGGGGGSCKWLWLQADTDTGADALPAKHCSTRKFKSGWEQREFAVHGWQTTPGSGGSTLLPSSATITGVAVRCRWGAGAQHDSAAQGAAAATLPRFDARLGEVLVSPPRLVPRGPPPPAAQLAATALQWRRLKLPLGARLVAALKRGLRACLPGALGSGGAAAVAQQDQGRLQVSAVLTWQPASAAPGDAAASPAAAAGGPAGQPSSGNNGGGGGGGGGDSSGGEQRVSPARWDVWQQRVDGGQGQQAQQSEAADGSGWQWMGSTPITRFVVPWQAAACAPRAQLRFAVQAVGIDGQRAELPQCACCVIDLSLPPPI